MKTQKKIIDNKPIEKPIENQKELDDDDEFENEETIEEVDEFENEETIENDDLDIPIDNLGTFESFDDDDEDDDQY